MMGSYRAAAVEIRLAIFRLRVITKIVNKRNHTWFSQYLKAYREAVWYVQVLNP